MRNTYLVMSVAAATMLIAACGGAPLKPPDSLKPIQVGVLIAQLESVPMMLAAPGTVQARDRIILSAQINGFVREVRVHAGDLVKAGQLLATLDARDAESQKEASQALIDEAQAALDEAQKGTKIAQSLRAAAQSAADLAGGTYARYQKLFETRSVSAQEMDEVGSRRDSTLADLAAKGTMALAAQDKLHQAEARLLQAQAQLRRSNVYVGWSTITAPSAGRIVERHVDPGSDIFPGSPLISLESNSGPQVLAGLPAGDMNRLRSGLEVQVLISDETQAPIQGHISEIIPSSSPESHSVQFKVDLPPALAAVSGSFAQVMIPAGERETLLIPAPAIRENGQLTGVFIADSSAKARFRLIKSIPFDAERVEVLTGLEPGERIVAGLAEQIVDGISLEIRQ
jgi:RND family efflux transporter MFP subunit